MKTERGFGLMGLISVLLWGFIGFSQLAFALPVPPHMKDLLINKGRQDLVQRFEAIAQMPPQEFIKRFLDSGEQRVLGAGFNGIVFKDAHDQVTKISFGIYAALGLVRLNPIVSRVKDSDLPALLENWKTLLQSPDVLSNPVAVVRKIDEPVGSQPMDEELLGTLLWAAYNPGYTHFPDMISTDGLAFRNHFVRGVPLKNILESQREGSDLYKKYNLPKIWQQVVFWQRIGETMLKDIGVTVDMFTPGNLIVGGTPEEPTIELIDNALARPTDQALKFYQARGISIPSPAFASELKLIVWPTISEHIVSNRLWDLDFAQSLEYVKAYSGVLNDHEAIDRMASFEEWAIIEAPFLGDFSKIRRARLLSAVRNGPHQSAARQATLLIHCAKLLEAI